MEQGNTYQRLTNAGGGDGAVPLPYYKTPAAGQGYAAYPRSRAQSPFPLLGKTPNTFSLLVILQFIQVAMLAVVVIVILIAVYGVSEHQGTVQNLVARAEVMENLARNVNDASQVMRRALGERSIDDPDHDHGRNKNKKKGDNSGWKNWLQDRGPDEEAMITDNAVQAIVRGVRTIVRLLEQAEESRLMAVASRLGEHTDEILSGPETAHILQTVDAAIRHPQTKTVAASTMDLLAHVEGGLLPVVDALAVELKQRLAELTKGQDPVMTKLQFRAMVREMMDVTHKVGTGLRDFVVWYRQGGPADATALFGHMFHTARELIESPAATSLVKVLEGIDWKVTGGHLADSAHNAAAILRSVNDAGTVDAGDRLIRAVAGMLEDPGTKKVMALLPGIAANATALLARPNAQRLIEHGSALMGRVDTVLSEAEAARTVERTAEFLTTLRLLLGALVDGGMHLEVGQPGAGGQGSSDYGYYGDDGGLERDQPSSTGQKPHQASLMDGVPRIVGYEPERSRVVHRGPVAHNNNNNKKRQRRS